MSDLDDTQKIVVEIRCRCGHKDVPNGTKVHPCHGKAHTCKAPAKLYLYNPTLTALAGAQMKFTATDTWACDECWAFFKSERTRIQESMDKFAKDSAIPLRSEVELDYVKHPNRSQW